MAHISIGGFTMTREASDMTIIKKDRIVASLKTYGGVAFFSWGTTINGKMVEIGWPVMEAAQFNQLQQLVETDVAVVFDPQDGSAKTYNTQIMGLEGKYFIYKETTLGYRRDVRLSLLILNEVV